MNSCTSASVMSLLMPASQPPHCAAWQHCARSVEHVLIGAETRPELAFEQFAAGIFGQRLDEEDQFRGLVPRQVAATMTDQFVLPQRCTVANDHGRDNRLDPQRMRDTEDRHLLHERVAIENLFDLAARDILATGLDHVLLAI